MEETADTASGGSINLSLGHNSSLSGIKSLMKSQELMTGLCFPTSKITESIQQPLTSTKAAVLYRRAHGSAGAGSAVHCRNATLIPLQSRELGWHVCPGVPLDREELEEVRHGSKPQEACC